MEGLKWKKKWHTQQISGSISGRSFEGNRSIAVFCKNKKVGRESGHPFVHSVTCTEKEILLGRGRDDGKTAGVGEENPRREMEREKGKRERGPVEAEWKLRFPVWEGGWLKVEERQEKNLSFETVLSVCTRGGGVLWLCVCVSGEVGSVCHREGQERREREIWLKR